MVALRSLLLTTMLNTTDLTSPSSHSLVTRGYPPCSSQLTCPSDSGCMSKSPQGDEYLVTCNVDFYGGDLDITQAPTLEKCLVACSYTNLCIGVSYQGQNCYMKKTITSNADGFGIREQYPFHDACPLANVSTYCGDNTGDGGCFSSAGGMPEYVVRCARDFPGGDSASKQVLPDLATCVQACQTMGKDKCAGVSWVPEEGECYFKQELNTPVYNEGVIGVAMV